MVKNAKRFIRTRTEAMFRKKHIQFMLAEPNRGDLLTMVNDANRFIYYNRSIIEKAPLQTYNSALIFSPKRSIVRRQFLSEFPNWIKNVPTVEEDWTPCLQTLEGHSDSVMSVAFSPDGQRLASGSHDRTVKI
ncbi:MAG: hypothetical protein M1813_009172 [Trichoglossum hirsutum]|nr:MAG: hypothetical protein M1813_009172 [Trichoglossum hirsutum]